MKETFGKKKRRPEDFLANEELELFSVFLLSSSENKRGQSAVCMFKAA